MALTEQVIMPGADYQDACDAIREKTGGTDLIKSGQIANIIREQFQYVDSPKPGQNLFDINSLVFVASNANDLNNYRPKVDGTALLSGGVSGETAGASVAIEVPENAVVNFQTVNNGEKGTIDIRAISSVTNGIHGTNETVVIQRAGVAAGATVDWTLTMPSGYALFAFALYGATRYCMRLENISVTIVDETAAALAVILGDAE